MTLYGVFRTTLGDGGVVGAANSPWSGPFHVGAPPVCDGHHILLHFGPATCSPARARVSAAARACPL